MLDAAKTDPKIVLIVEDEALIRWALQQMLEEAGLTVLEASDVHSALDCVRRNGVCAILLDLRLPDGSGLEVLQAFRDLHPECPAWVMTAYGTPAAEQEAERLGVIEFVKKPFELAGFVKKVVAIIES